MKVIKNTLLFGIKIVAAVAGGSPCAARQGCVRVTDWPFLCGTMQ